MKLRKLLPLATIASTVAIVTPLVTSCGAGTYILDLTKQKEYKMVDQVEGSMKNAEATAKYFEAIAKNPKIYADDIFWINIGRASDDVPEGIEGTITFKITNIDKENQRISASYRMKESGETEYQGTKYKVDMDYTSQITNVPFEMSYYADFGTNPTWHFVAKYGEDITKWAADDKWTATSLDGHTFIWVNDAKVTDETIKKMTYDSKSKLDEVFDQYVYSIVSEFDFLESHYFANVTLEK